MKLLQSLWLKHAGDQGLEDVTAAEEDVEKIQGLMATTQVDMKIRRIWSVICPTMDQERHAPWILWIDCAGALSARSSVKVVLGDVNGSPMQGVTLTRPDSVDGDGLDVCSPTLAWTCCNEVVDQCGLQSDAKVFQRDHDQVLSAMLRSEVASGSKIGCIVKAYPLVGNIARDLAITESTWCTLGPRVSVFSLVFLLEKLVSVHCPHCGVPNHGPLLPNVPTTGSPLPEINVLMKYMPRPEAFTVEGRLGAGFPALLREIWIDDFRGVDGPNRCFLLWNDDVPLLEDSLVALFNGVIVGIFGMALLFWVSI